MLSEKAEMLQGAGTEADASDVLSTPWTVFRRVERYDIGHLGMKERDSVPR